MTQRAILCAVDLGKNGNIEHELAEFEALAEAAGAVILERIVQRRETVDPATLVGSGKAEEISQRARDTRAELLLVLNDVRPRQRRNLEKLIPLPIVDRTMLILDVFARHARSREGKLQVELAQLRYRQSNLIGAGAELSRLGGGIGTRGPGETKLEVDRRRIGARITVLRRLLVQVGKQRSLRRPSQRRDPLVALVGYTNVGKSSLLNALAHSNAYVADRPFATLDPTVRRTYLGPDKYVRLADTVGFITDLPADLINAFRATLEELSEAELLLHVLDASDGQWRQRSSAVDKILGELALDGTARLVIFNKVDEAVAEALGQPEALYVSATTGSGLPELRKELAQRLFPLNRAATP